MGLGCNQLFSNPLPPSSSSLSLSLSLSFSFWIPWRRLRRAPEQFLHGGEMCFKLCGRISRKNGWASRLSDNHPAPFVITYTDSSSSSYFSFFYFFFISFYYDYYLFIIYLLFSPRLLLVGFIYLFIFFFKSKEVFRWRKRCNGSLLMDEHFKFQFQMANGRGWSIPINRQSLKNPKQENL